MGMILCLLFHAFIFEKGAIADVLYHGISITTEIKLKSPVSGTWVNKNGSSKYDWIGVFLADEDPSQGNFLWWKSIGKDGLTTGKFTTEWVVPN